MGSRHTTERQEVTRMFWFKRMLMLAAMAVALSGQIGRALAAEEGPATAHGATAAGGTHGAAHEEHGGVGEGPGAPPPGPGKIFDPVLGNLVFLGVVGGLYSAAVE